GRLVVVEATPGTADRASRRIVGVGAGASGTARGAPAQPTAASTTPIRAAIGLVGERSMLSAPAYGRTGSRPSAAGSSVASPRSLRSAHRLPPSAITITTREATMTIEPIAINSGRSPGVRDPAYRNTGYVGRPEGARN